MELHLKAEKLMQCWVMTFNFSSISIELSRQGKPCMFVVSPQHHQEENIGLISFLLIIYINKRLFTNTSYAVWAFPFPTRSLAGMLPAAAPIDFSRKTSCLTGKCQVNSSVCFTHFPSKYTWETIFIFLFRHVAAMFHSTYRQITPCPQSSKERQWFLLEHVNWGHKWYIWIESLGTKIRILWDTMTSVPNTNTKN